MAKKPSSGSGGKRAAAKPKKAAARKPARATGKSGPATASSRGKKSRSSSRRPSSEMSAADALIKLLESPLVADVLAVAMTAALATIAESRFSRRTPDDTPSGSTLKAAAKAAAAAVGRRLSTEIEEIRKAAEKARANEGA